MATSSSVNYAVTRDDIITEAYQICGVVGEGGTANANQLTDGARTLNMMVKAWNAKLGLPLWAIEKLVLFPIKAQADYSFGASADRMCKTSELVKTELAAAVTANDTTITVDSVTGMANGDVIGVQTDSGGIIWTTISDGALDTTIDLAAAITSDAAVNNNVYTYTTAFAQRILGVENAWRKTDGGTDIPISIISRQEYIDLSDKTSAGVVNQVYYDPQLATGVLSVWQVPSDSQTEELIYLRATRILEDFDASGDTPDFPQEWYLALCWGLAVLRGPSLGVMGRDYADIKATAKEILEDTMDFDTEDGSLFIMPENSQGSYRR